MRSTSPSLLLVAVAALASAAPADAQCEPEPEPPPNLRAVARDHYTRGVEASAGERWMEARDAFRQAYDVAPFAPIVYNLATAQTQTVEAAENYRRFLRRCQSEQTPELRADAQQLLAALTPRIGRLTLRVANFAPAVDRLELDGETLAAAVLDSALPIDPGEHELRVVREGEAILDRQVTIDEGERRTLEVALPEYVAPVADAGGGPGGATAQAGGDDTGLIVGVVIGVVLAVGAAVAIPTAVVLGDRGGGGPQEVDGTWPAARLPLVSW